MRAVFIGHVLRWLSGVTRGLTLRLVETTQHRSASIVTTTPMEPEAVVAAGAGVHLAS